MNTTPTLRRPPPLVAAHVQQTSDHPPARRTAPPLRVAASVRGSRPSSSRHAIVANATVLPVLRRPATAERPAGRRSTAQQRRGGTTVTRGSSPQQRRRQAPPAAAPSALVSEQTDNPVFDVEAQRPPLPPPGASEVDKNRGTPQQQVRKALTLWKENPANFHQAACVFILGGKAGERSSKFPRPENVSRMTNAEMELAWEAASGSISKNERLVCHFTSMDAASTILGVDSPGFRASAVGQGGGGFFVCSVGPHELEWEQYQSASFRERTGRELWGENWQHLLEGEKDADKVEMVFFLKIPTPFYEQGSSIPGRDLARIIPPEVLYERDGYHWLQKEKIVKSYMLVRDAPALEIAGEGPPPETNVGLKCFFAVLSLGLVLFQALALLAIIWNTMNPSCMDNLHCGRVGTYCRATGGTGGRCDYCAWVGHPAVLDEANATAFCADATRLSAEYCDGSTANGKKACAHPACRACPGSTEDPNPGWGVPYHLAITSTGHDRKHYPDDRWMENSTFDGPVSIGNSTWGITSEHTIVRGNVAAMQYSDYAMLALASTVVSFNLADEIRDIKLCEITIHDRAGTSPWRWRSYALVGAVGVLGFVPAIVIAEAAGLKNAGTAFYLLVVTPAAVTLIDVRSGNSPWRVFLLATNALRRFAVVPLLASAVPFLVLYDSANAKDMALNTVGALFLLSVDNEAFAYALPDHIRTHVEEYGRAELGEKEAGVLNAVKTWTWIPLVAAMVFPVLAVKHLHDPAGGWMRNPFDVALLVPLYAMMPGVAAEAIRGRYTGGDAGTATVAERAAVGTLAAGQVVCLALFFVRGGSGGSGAELFWYLAGSACGLVLLALLRRLDGRDGGGRLMHSFAGLGKWFAGAGAVFAATAFMDA